MNSTMPRRYYWVSGFFLLDTFGAFGFIDQMVTGNWNGKGGDNITQALNLLMITASLILLGESLRRRKRAFAAGSLLAISAVGFLCLSALWSLDPWTTLRIAVVYLFVILGVIGIAGTMDADEYMHLLSWCCFLSAIASLLLTIAAPRVAFVVGDNEGGLNFNGIFLHKNVLGQVMAIGALATLHDIRVTRRRYFGKLFMLFLLMGMAYASKSAGALMVALLYCGISVFDSLWRKRGAARTSGVILAVLLAPLIILAVITPDTLLELIGKDPTLTGRTEIWAYVIPDIWMKPWLGWGYFSFWQLTNPAALEISNAVHWVVPHAHNGLLEFPPRNRGSRHSPLCLHSHQDHRPGRPVSENAGKGSGDIDALMLCRDTADGRERTRLDCLDSGIDPHRVHHRPNVRARGPSCKAGTQYRIGLPGNERSRNVKPKYYRSTSFVT